MADFNLGTVTAYGYAKDKGYTGTEDEFAELMASYAQVAEDAAESAEQAAQSATTATTKAGEAATSATNAANANTAAQAAKTGAETAAQTATTKADEASGSAATATTKAAEASTSATNAAQSATTATTKAGEATTSATNAAASASAAAGSAQTAQDVADSIPADYTQLSEDVSSLKEELDDLPYSIYHSTQITNDKYLDKDIILGIHLHENKGSSYAMAQEFLRKKSDDSDRIALVDGTIYGIGEVPGNLRLEQMIDFLNRYHDADYEIDPIYRLIDKYFVELKKKRNWEYDLPYAISSKYGINRKYAQFLIEQGDVGILDMSIIMKDVQGKDKPSYNKVLIKELYENYKMKKG